MPKTKKKVKDPHEWRRPRHSNAHAECMMCLLDAFNVIEERMSTVRTENEAIIAIRNARSEVGSFTVRDWLIALAKPVEELWKDMSSDYRNDVAFDWEFCDDVLLYAVDWNYSLERIKLKPNAKDLLIAHRELRMKFGKGEEAQAA